MICFTETKRRNSMDTAVDSLQRFNSLLAQLQSSLEHEEKNVFYSYSLLWSALLTSRQSTEQFNDFVTLLNDCNTGTKGVAAKVSDEHKNRFIAYCKHYVTIDMLERTPLSMVGAPTIIDFGGVAANTAYLQNVVLFDEIVSTMLRAGIGANRLCIAEIGAGYGGLASLMLAAGIAERYTIIDLPENLKLSAYYLTEQFRCWAWRFLSRKSPVGAIEPGSLNFVTPGNIGALDAIQFDLVINTDSLGEMPKMTAQAYVAWIADHLSENGCFFSKNGHRRGKDSIIWPSEYGYDRFQLRSLTGVSAAGSLFDDHSHHVLLSRKHAETPPYDWSDFDSLCTLYALGLNSEIAEVSEAFIRHRLADEHKNFLRDVRNFIKASTAPEKLAAVGLYEGNLRACGAYLSGLAHLIGGGKDLAKKFLEQYLEVASSHVSEAM